ncbi:hypothetical protein CH54_1424 [Yersinia rochesterensis]|uniref:Uncharacterized protein n=1 Tax=Yersinia rochesterensis TaxID=1604335 RepID=A0ABN4FKW8_9GAMM|nr:hypothetical protein DJ57_2271 [Yersinia rochesterensis]AJI87884.1 hypothetical protein AW19_240 [Yersinia frederiksenii Y225]AJJ36292.1 hypothetical protein CH54_1424 [Yersinia rochesterensis]
MANILTLPRSFWIYRVLLALVIRIHPCRTSTLFIFQFQRWPWNLTTSSNSFRPRIEGYPCQFLYLDLTQPIIDHSLSKLGAYPVQNRLSPGEHFSTTVVITIPAVPLELGHNIVSCQSEWVNAPQSYDCQELSKVWRPVVSVDATINTKLCSRCQLRSAKFRYCHLPY